MKTIKYITLLFVILYAFAGNAQTKKITKGDKSYDVYSYEECINKFEGVTNKSIELKRKLAESYLKTGDYFNAEKYSGEVAQSDKSNSEDIYNYASVLKINKKYDEADTWMNKFYQLEQGDSRAKMFVQNKGIINDLLNDREQFIIKNLGINMSAQDFGTSYYGKDQVVFASTRPSAKLFKRIWNWNELPFLDLYVADIQRTQLENVKQFKKKFNKKYHEGPASFDKTGNFMAFTLNNYENKSKDGVVKLQIYTSEKKGKKWQEPVSLNFNNSEYSVGHPALTEDGEIMYFASNMPGGFGGTDIYISKRNDDGTWNEPVNLGKPVNTEGNEMFPFIHKNGILFFASDGHPGLGGLDIFMTKKSENEWLQPQNLGVPVNSNFDDFAFIIDDITESGFFSSNREDGKGNDDIYSFKLVKKLSFDIIIQGKVKDNYGNILANTNVSLFDQENNPVKTVNTDAKGNYEFKAHQNELYSVKAEKPKYQSDEKNIDTKGKSSVSADLVLEKLPDFIVSVFIVDTDSKNKLSAVKIVSINNKSAEKETLTSSEYGKFLIKLPDYKLYDSIDYTFITEKEGYASKTVDFKQILKKFGEYNTEIQMNKISLGGDLGKIIEINPIYFDFNKYNIRPDAAFELDKIVKIMNEYPTMEIELSSYTDCRGSSIYNRNLSDRRAKASADYIKKRISKPTRINGQGYGETQPVNDCACEGGRGRGLECTEEQHQQNRRTEFKIIRK